MPEIEWIKLNGICQSATFKILSAISKARSILNEGHDLPGLWPMFYLYPDLTWEVAYDPRARDHICILDADNRPSESFMHLVTINLRDGWTVGPRPVLTAQSHAVHEQKIVVEHDSTHGRPATEAKAAPKERSKLKKPRKSKKQKEVW